ncbi:hypothetical protein K2X05_09460 [bacterium]|nr:hypothetical protein [bacterium]
MLKYILTLLLLLPQITFAGFALNPTYGIYKTDSESMSQLELRVGYKFDFGLYLGGFYNVVSQKYLKPETSSDYFLGLQAGYEYHGLYGLAGYVLDGDQDMDSGGTKYSGATGLQVTLGYRLPVMEDVYLGPEITYRKVSFKDKEISGIASSVSRHDETIIPAISLYFAF